MSEMLTEMGMPHDAEITLVLNRAYMCYELYIVQPVGPNNYREIKPIELEWGEPKSRFSVSGGPVCRIPERILRKALNDLDKHGTRPKNQDRIDGELDATKLHLADMQEMAKDMVAKFIGKRKATETK